MTAIKKNKKTSELSVIDLANNIINLNANFKKKNKIKIINSAKKEYISKYILNCLLDLKSYYFILDKNILYYKISAFSLGSLMLILALHANLAGIASALLLGLNIAGLQKLLKLRTVVKQALEEANFIETALLPTTNSYNDIFLKLNDLQKKLLEVKQTPISLLKLISLRKFYLEKEFSSSQDIEVLSEFKKLK